MAEWLNKIPNWIKIPLKILLPSLTIFSGFLILENDLTLTKLYLLDFRNNNGFVFGLIFLICISLIICYILSFLLSFIIKKFKEYNLKRLQFETYINLPDAYKAVLQKMYKIPKHSMYMRMSDAYVTYLLSIHAIGTPNVSVNRDCFDYFLQPWIVTCIDKTIKMTNKRKSKINKILKKEKNQDSVKSLKQELTQCEEYLNFITEVLETNY